MSLQMASNITYWLEDSELDYAYKLDNDSSIILLRTKKNLNMIPGVTDLVPVTPVSASERPIAHGLTFEDVLAIALFLGLGILGHFILVCVLRYRNWITHRRNQRNAMQEVQEYIQYSRRHYHLTPDTLRALALLKVVMSMRRPVKDNIRHLQLPRELQRELIHLRRFPLAVMGEYPGRI